MEREYWKSVEGFSKYRVSDLGNIKNIKTGKVLKYQTVGGKATVTLMDNECKPHTVIVARIVAKAFVERRYDDADYIEHKNGDKFDCRAENLRWVSRSKQQYDMWDKNGGHHSEEAKNKISNSLSGENNPSCKNKKNHWNVGNSSSHKYNIMVVFPDGSKQTYENVNVAVEKLGELGYELNANYIMQIAGGKDSNGKPRLHGHLHMKSGLSFYKVEADKSNVKYKANPNAKKIKITLHDDGRELIFDSTRVASEELRKIGISLSDSSICNLANGYRSVNGEKRNLKYGNWNKRWNLTVEYVEGSVVDNA